MINRKWIGLFVSYLVILNGLFIGIELYKENIRNQWSSQQLVASQAFQKLERLNESTVMIESTLSISIIIISIWLIVGNKTLVKSFIVVSAWIELVFLIIGLLLATYFEIAILNLVQQLLGPSFILIVLVIYQVIRHFCVRPISYKKIKLFIKKIG